ncbi:MAG TPA: alanine racemase [Kamptonema sp.]|nr:alanine racemase [Kamptonema sp.]
MSALKAMQNRQVKSEIAGVKIDDLVAEFGSPLFVYSERSLRRKFFTIRNAFAIRYPDVAFSWSYKTNHLKAICAIMHSCGAMAELVSKIEYDKAKSLGILENQIILNGPHQPFETLEAAVRDGAIVNVDCLDKIYDLEAIATRIGQVISVGLQLNFDVGIQPKWSRFGFNLESGQAMEAIRRIASGGKLRVNGLHSHINPFIIEPATYTIQVEKIVKFGYQIEAEFGWRMQSINIAGGFPSRSRRKGMYHASEVILPLIDEYADAICDALWANLKPGHTPKLIIESGRAMAEEAGTLITTVCRTKCLPDRTSSYVVNAIDEGISLPPLSRGTRLVISTIGAYNNRQWMQFMASRPNVVLVTETGNLELMREAEYLSDLEC